ncbi:MAG: flagellar biosynthesis protein FlgN [Burkholderiales bacterium]|jgi:flagella synthesis protein FlgN
METVAISPAEIFNEEREAVHSLLELLRQEQTHLIDADVDGLAKVTEQKAKTATHMSDLAKRRHHMLSAAGFDATESGMQAWIDSPASSTADRESWKVLLELAQSAKELNRVNGLLISQHMGRNQSALNVLHGAQGGGSFYGPNGQSTTKIGSRRLVVG